MNMIQMLSGELDEFHIHWITIVEIPKMKHLIADIANASDEFAHKVLVVIKCVFERFPVARNKDRVVTETAFHKSTWRADIQ